MLTDMRQEDKETTRRWEPSGSWWKDYLHFCGPGWFVAIAYVDPGNYQADIQAGATAGYNLLWTVWWATVLSVYVQVLCARLAVVGQITLAEVQRDNFPRWFRYLCWVIAEFSVVITDLPEVVGFGVALNIFFGIPYYVGVLISPVTTILFLATQEVGGMRIMEGSIVFLVGVMSITLWVETGLVGVDGQALMEGWVFGFAKPNGGDVFSVLGIIGAVVMPHNLYLHTASVMSRPCKRERDIVNRAKFWTSLEPVVPILVSFFINVAVVCLSAESVYGQPGADTAGVTNFTDYLQLKGGKIMWGLALLAAAQSSSITTTYSGQYIMDGFLNLRIPVWQRAVASRLVAIVPCVIVASTMDAEALNVTVNLVNALLALLLPFALTPLAKFCTSTAFLGEEHCAPFWEKVVIWSGAFAVYLVNAVGLTAAGGGFFGSFMFPEDGVQTAFTVQMGILNDICQILFLAWNLFVIFTPIVEPMRPITCTRSVEDENCFGVVNLKNQTKPIVQDA